MDDVRYGTATTLIAGGGHAGLLLALSLDRAGLPVTVVEAQALKTVMAAPFDGRALALMYGSRRVLDGLGLWTAFSDIAEPVSGVRVRDDGTGATMAFDAAGLDKRVGSEPAFAYGITNRDLRRRLLELCQARPGIRLLAPARVVRLERSGGALVVTLEDGARLAARLVVGADGRGSLVRKLAQIGARRWQYPQTAITFALALPEPHDHCVREYLRPAGPLALLPIGPDLFSVTWVERHAVAERLLALDGPSLVQELQERVEIDLAGARLRGQPTGHRLGGLQATRYSAARVALVGDAAHGLHPIHAQGFNLGVRDVAALAEVVVESVRAGEDPGGAEALVRYDRLRRADARLTVGLTDGLNRLFSNDLPAAKLVRGLGFAAIERLAPLKQLAMRRGMGMVGDLPRRARGEPL
jgi:2-octaprenyl-6-methoxyphenol hydroxylase